MNVVPLAVDWFQLRENLYHEGYVVSIVHTVVRVLVFAKYVFYCEEPVKYLDEILV